jgi:uncharacterized membrane protein
MEQDLIDLYLQQVRRHLEILPQRRRDRAMGEIGLHINTSRAVGRSAEATIERLGPPEALAAAYIERYEEAPSHASPVGGVVRRGLALSAWAAGLIVVPAFALVALVLALAALVVPMFGVLHLFSPGWIVMGFAGWEVPNEWSVPVAAAVGGLLGAGAWLIWAGLRMYVRWAALEYERHVAAPGRQSQTT